LLYAHKFYIAPASVIIFPFSEFDIFTLAAPDHRLQTKLRFYFSTYYCQFLPPLLLAFSSRPWM